MQKTKGALESLEVERQKRTTVDQARMEVKKKQEQLHLKQLEYQILNEMDMKEVNKMLLENNAIAQQQIKELFNDGNIKEPEMLIDLNAIETRKPRMENYAKKYVDQSKNIYKKPTPPEIKELVEQFNQNTRVQGSKQVDNFQQLYAEYYAKYSAFLYQQPAIEQSRKQLILELGEVHELLSVLNNAPTFEKPAIWNKQQLPEEDKKFVEEIVDKNVRLIENKYEFSVNDIEDDGILRDVKEFLKQKYFKGVDWTKN